MGVVLLSCLRCSWRYGKNTQMRWRSRCACCWQTMRCCRSRWRMSGLAWPTSGPAQQAGPHPTSFVMTTLFAFLVQLLVWYMCCMWQLLKLSGCQLQRARNLQGEIRFALPLKYCSAPALSANLY